MREDEGISPGAAAESPAEPEEMEITIREGAEESDSGVPATAQAPAPVEPAAAEAQLQSLRDERDRLYDRWLRAQADFENFRKRTERDRENWRRQARENIVRELLPVLDNFERALLSLPAGVPPALVEGVTLIYRQMQEILSRQGLTAMETSGQTFDPHYHEAVETEVRDDAPHHLILGEMQKGYLLDERVLRPALVKVAVRPDEDLSEEPS